MPNPVDPTELTPEEWQEYLHNAIAALHQNPQDHEALQAIRDANEALSAYDQASVPKGLIHDLHYNEDNTVIPAITGAVRGMGKVPPALLAGLEHLVEHPIQTTTQMIENLPGVPGRIAKDFSPSTASPEGIGERIAKFGSMLLPGGGRAARVGKTMGAPFRAIGSVLNRQGLKNNLLEQQTLTSAAEAESQLARADYLRARTDNVGNALKGVRRGPNGGGQGGAPATPMPKSPKPSPMPAAPNNPIDPNLVNLNGPGPTAPGYTTGGPAVGDAAQSMESAGQTSVNQIRKGPTLPGVDRYAGPPRPKAPAVPSEDFVETMRAPRNSGQAEIGNPIEAFTNPTQIHPQGFSVEGPPTPPVRTGDKTINDLNGANRMGDLADQIRAQRMRDLEDLLGNSDDLVGHNLPEPMPKPIGTTPPNPNAITHAQLLTGRDPYSQVFEEDLPPIDPALLQKLIKALQGGL